MGGLAPFAALPRPRCASPASDTPSLPAPPVPGTPDPGTCLLASGDPRRSRARRGRDASRSPRSRRTDAPPPPAPVRSARRRPETRPETRSKRRATPPRARTPEAPRLTLGPPSRVFLLLGPSDVSFPPPPPPRERHHHHPARFAPVRHKHRRHLRSRHHRHLPARNRTELATTLTRGPHRCASCPPPPPSPP